MSPCAAAYFLIHVVELDDFFGLALDAHVDGFAVAVVAIVADGQDAGEDDADFVGVGEFVHGLKIAFDLLDGHRAGVAGEIVGAGEDDDDFWLERDDVWAKAYEHLRSGLAADAAVDVRLAGKEAAKLGLDPGVGDGVAHEDDAFFGFGGRLDGGVGVVVAGDVGPVLEGFLGGSEFGGELVAVAWLAVEGVCACDECGNREKGCGDEKGKEDFHFLRFAPRGRVRENGVGVEEDL